MSARVVADVHRETVVHQRLNLGQEIDAGLAVEEHLGRRRGATVVVVAVELAELREPLLEEPATAAIGSGVESQTERSCSAIDDRLRHRSEFFQRGRRCFGVEPGRRENLLVVIEDRIAHVERHGPLHTFGEVLTERLGLEVAGVVGLCFDACTDGNVRLGVIHHLNRVLGGLHDVGQTAARLQILVESLLVTTLVLEADLHLGLRGVVFVGESHQRLLQFTVHAVPERDVHGLGGTVERRRIAGGKIGERCGTGGWRFGRRASITGGRRLGGAAVDDGSATTSTGSGRHRDDDQSGHRSSHASGMDVHVNLSLLRR